MASYTPSSRSRPSGSATSVRRAMPGVNFFRIWLRQLFMGAPFHPQKQHRHHVGQDPGLGLDFLLDPLFLSLQLAQAVVPNVGQANTLDGSAPGSKGILGLVAL